MRLLTATTFLLTFILDMNAQTTGSNKILGRLINNKKENVVGANIVVKGTVIGTVTDSCGEFEIEIPEDSNTLIISWLCPTFEINLEKIPNIRTETEIILMLTKVAEKSGGKDNCKKKKPKGKITKV